MWILNEMNEEKLFKNYINFILFGTTKILIWFGIVIKNGHSISFSSYFQNAKCIGQQNFLSS
jgi:hypothetical protein